MVSDVGMSHFDSETALSSLAYSGAGMMGTFFVKFVPNRSTCLYARLIGESRLESILRTELLGDVSLQAFRHSGYGVGPRIGAEDFVVFGRVLPTKVGKAEVE